MAFGAYLLQRERVGVSLKRPLIKKGNLSSHASDDLEDDPEYPLPSRCLEGRGRPNRYLSHLIALAAGAGIFILGFQTILLWKLWRQSGSPEILGEVNGLVPSVGMTPKHFAPNPNFDPLNISDDGWMRVMPRGGGFVIIQDWQDKGLPAPIQVHGKAVYNIAVFHQLHCLHVLAEEFDNLLKGRKMGDKTSKRAGHKTHNGHNGHNGHHGGSKAEKMDGEETTAHIRHCFEYIKASLTCCADAALEGQKSDINQPAADGFGSHHACRNFDAVFDWAETHRGTDQTGYPHPH